MSSLDVPGTSSPLPSANIHSDISNRTSPNQSVHCSTAANSPHTSSARSSPEQKNKRPKPFMDAAKKKKEFEEYLTFLKKIFKNEISPWSKCEIVSAYYSAKGNTSNRIEDLAKKMIFFHRRITSDSISIATQIRIMFMVQGCLSTKLSDRINSFDKNCQVDKYGRLIKFKGDPILLGEEVSLERESEEIVELNRNKEMYTIPWSTIEVKSLLEYIYSKTDNSTYYLDLIEICRDFKVSKTGRRSEEQLVAKAKQHLTWFSNDENENKKKKTAIYILQLQVEKKVLDSIPGSKIYQLNIDRLVFLKQPDYEIGQPDEKCNDNLSPLESSLLNFIQLFSIKSLVPLTDQNIADAFLRQPNTKVTNAQKEKMTSYVRDVCNLVECDSTTNTFIKLHTLLITKTRVSSAFEARTRQYHYGSVENGLISDYDAKNVVVYFNSDTGSYMNQIDDTIDEPVFDTIQEKLAPPKGLNREMSKVLTFLNHFLKLTIQSLTTVTIWSYYAKLNKNPMTLNKFVEALNGLKPLIQSCHHLDMLTRLRLLFLTRAPVSTAFLASARQYKIEQGSLGEIRAFTAVVDLRMARNEHKGLHPLFGVMTDRTDFRHSTLFQVQPRPNVRLFAAPEAMIPGKTSKEVLCWSRKTQQLKMRDELESVSEAVPQEAIPSTEECAREKTGSLESSGNHEIIDRTTENHIESFEPTGQEDILDKIEMTRSSIHSIQTELIGNEHRSSEDLNIDRGSLRMSSPGPFFENPAADEMTSSSAEVFDRMKRPRPETVQNTNEIQEETEMKEEVESADDDLFSKEQLEISINFALRIADSTSKFLDLEIVLQKLGQTFDASEMAEKIRQVVIHHTQYPGRLTTSERINMIYMYRIPLDKEKQAVLATFGNRVKFNDSGLMTCFYAKNRIKPCFGEPFGTNILSHLKVLTKFCHSKVVGDDLIERFMKWKRKRGDNNPIDKEYLRERFKSVHSRMDSKSKYDVATRIKMLWITNTRISNGFTKYLNENGTVRIVEGNVESYENETVKVNYQEWLNRSISENPRVESEPSTSRKRAHEHKSSVKDVKRLKHEEFLPCAAPETSFETKLPGISSNAQTTSLGIKSSISDVLPDSSMEQQSSSLHLPSSSFSQEPVETNAKEILKIISDYFPISKRKELDEIKKEIELAKEMIKDDAKVLISDVILTLIHSFNCVSRSSRISTEGNNTVNLSEVLTIIARIAINFEKQFVCFPEIEQIFDKIIDFNDSPSGGKRIPTCEMQLVIENWIAICVETDFKSSIRNLEVPQIRNYVITSSADERPTRKFLLEWLKGFSKTISCETSKDIQNEIQILLEKEITCEVKIEPDVVLRAFQFGFRLTTNFLNTEQECSGDSVSVLDMILLLELVLNQLEISILDSVRMDIKNFQKNYEGSNLILSKKRVRLIERTFIMLFILLPAASEPECSSYSLVKPPKD